MVPNSLWWSLIAFDIFFIISDALWYSLVVYNGPWWSLMRQGIAQLNWPEFQSLWDKIRRWTDIFLMFDKNKTKRLEYQEVKPALREAGIMVDDLVMQLVGLRYTEPDMTISFPGFLYLVMKMESMIHKFQSYDMMGMGTVNVSYRQ
ncbi:calpain-1 catalytic subunit, partial [Oryzias melastigma]|uniref:calpain-1 catalytic subunit n=1 Tax=Oryzias melastigma TaxID=30732 RepID=UPI000CF7DB96